MATAAVTLPRTRRRPRNVPAAGRASFPEFYFVKHIDNSHLVREVDVERRRECFSLLGLGVLVFLFVLLFAWQHFQCVRYGYQVEQLKTERAALDEWNHQLRLEQASLADPQRIDTLARTRLGMVSPSPQQVIRVGEPEPAAAISESPELARNFSAGGGENPHEP
ncbi:MAG: cell division protein FtsL [Acidobacteriia bacterium]|nr:cell division protein FtsL [Terriglobia bacterium]